jgi:acetyltransferase-like isoleucine patch superfamily enzyme
MKLFLAFLIGCIPFNSIKIFLFRLVFNYQVDQKSRIGFSIILCEHVQIGPEVRIGNFNLISNVKNFVLKANSGIAARNVIKDLIGFELDEGSSFGNANRFGRDPAVSDHGKFYLGKKSRITTKHLFDLTDDISIGDNTVIGGIGSQFWTHGFDIYRNGIRAPIVIKNNCFLGSSCMVNLGVTIESRTQIGMGSVVSKSIETQNGFWVSNQLTRNGDVINISQEEGYILDQKCPANRFYYKIKLKG